MRKVYIMRDDEQDGAVADALEAQGVVASEYELENPRCPLCNSCTLLAYTRGSQYEVLIYSEMDEKEVAGADTWYLVCSNFECRWEEQVERVLHPMDATIFDLHGASFEFDDEWGLINRSPDEMRELIDFTQALLKRWSNRKLQFYLEEAESRYDWCMRRTRRWLQRVPAGRRVQLTVDHNRIKGIILAATDHGCLFLKKPGDEMITIDTERIDDMFPLRFDEGAPELPEEDEQGRIISALEFTMVDCGTERVVVRGHELTLEHVDRLGLYHVHTRDAAAGAALGLAESHSGYWEGRFRRAEIEMRYDLEEIIRVKGHWVKVSGHNSSTNDRAVWTENEEIARDLGLKLQKPLKWGMEEDDELNPPRVNVPRWYGDIPDALVEECREVRRYYWPIPELHTADDECTR